MNIPFIGFDEMDPHLSWQGITDAMIAGHQLAKPSITDGFAYRGDDTLLSRAAWIDGLGAAVKSATIMPSNVPKGRPMVNGGVMLFSDETGTLEAIIDFHLVTKWKTAGDSLLGAKLLARPDIKKVLIVGAGTVGANLVSAYKSAFDGLKFNVWNRTPEKAVAFAERLGINHTPSLADAVENADVVCCATMSTEPVLRGEWLQQGQHVDLIGAYRPDMREVDDTALTRAHIFVDSRETTLAHIGELKIPLESGVICETDVLGDLYDLAAGSTGRTSANDITLFKNGGGAHLDLITAKYILDKWKGLNA